MEKQGSRKLRLSAKQTMQIAERLYTQGFISYPRTETNIFPKEMNLTSLVTQQSNGNAPWSGFAQRVLEEGISPRQGKKSDQAHPPIHPTKFADSLNGNLFYVIVFHDTRPRKYWKTHITCKLTCYGVANFAVICCYCIFLFSVPVILGFYRTYRGREMLFSNRWAKNKNLLNINVNEQRTII